jgi:hypothetical protein
MLRDLEACAAEAGWGWVKDGHLVVAHGRHCETAFIGSVRA